MRHAFAPSLSRLLLCAVAFACVRVLAQTAEPSEAVDDPRVLRWPAADLVFALPDGCEQPEGEEAALPTPELTIPCSLYGGDIHLRVLPAQTTEAGAETGFLDAIAAADMLPLRYFAQPLFGLPGLRGEVVSANRAITGLAQTGRLPDSRVLIAVSRNEGDEPLRQLADGAFTRLLNSVAFSAGSAPTPTNYVEQWSASVGEPVAALTPSGDGQTILVAGVNSLHLLDQSSGALLSSFPYSAPSQITGMGESQGIVYLGDRLCRCTQVFSLFQRTWQDSIDTFGANAPADFLIYDALRFGVDLLDSDYAIYIGGLRRETRYPLQDEQADAPHLMGGLDRLYTLEWVRSLLDSTVSGALMDKGENGAENTLVRWLPYSPDQVADSAVFLNTLVVLSRDGTVEAVPLREGESVRWIGGLPTPTALSINGTGALWIGSGDGSVRAFSDLVETTRRGAETLLSHVPVQGMVSEAAPVQQWTYSPDRDVRVTFNLIETNQANEFDVALRVLAADGREVAYNDDQLGADLFGLLDAQIADLRLAPGTYTVEAQWVGGDGVYTLGVTADRTFSPDPQGAIEITGELMDVFPVERLVFQGRAGEALTFSMFGESGTLDPALELLRPDGTTLAYNDDAFDPELGVNAQIVRVELPADGEYVLEASRFEGAGEYTIVVVMN